MDIKLEAEEDVLTAILWGELDHHSAAEIRGTVDQAILTFRTRYLIFDFSGVDFMDSAGIGVVMGRYNRMKELGGQVFLIHCSEYVDRILEMAGVYTIAKRGDSREAALQWIQLQKRPAKEAGNESHRQNERGDEEKQRRKTDGEHPEPEKDKQKQKNREEALEGEIRWQKKNVQEVEE